jgi:hypothetical protein
MHSSVASSLPACYFFNLKVMLGVLELHFFCSLNAFGFPLLFILESPLKDSFQTILFRVVDLLFVG